MKILFLLAQSDSHREEILEFPNERVEYHSQHKEDMVIFENAFSLRLGVVLPLGTVFFCLTNQIAFLVQVTQVLVQ